MRVLMLNYEFPPLGGGAGNACYYILRELSSRNEIEVDLITSSSDRFIQEQFSPNIRVFRLDVGKRGKNLHYQGWGDLLQYVWKARFLANKLVKEQIYDVTHAWFGIPGGLVAVGLGVPYVVCLRGSDVPGYSDRMKWLERLGMTMIHTAIWKRADTMLALSEELRTLALKSWPRGDMGVIRNGVDTERFRPLKGRSSSDVMTFLYVGRLIPRKGVFDLIHAASRLPAKSKWKIVLVGEGPDGDSLKKLVRSLGLHKRVVFTGMVGHNRLVEYYQAADVFVLPSHHESMSNAQLEAIACGLPVIVTKTGGTLLSVDGNGLLVEVGDLDSLVGALLRLLEDRSLRREMGKRSREIALTLNWESVAEEYFKVYTSVMGHTASH